jgi:PST family polysaccharide transporter
MSGHELPRFADSVRWQSINVGAQVVLQLVFIWALARLLTPADFGVMSIALVVVGFVEVFAQIGIGPSIVQKATLAADDLRTAGLFSVALGALFYAGLWAAAPAVGAWYSDALLSDVLRVIALSFILGGVAVVPRSYLVRQMAFKRLFVGAMAGMLIGNFGVGLLLAWQGAGVWAYVAALLAQNLVLGLVYWGFTWRASRGGRWSGAALRAMLGYGGRSTLYNFATYAASKADTVIVGRFATQGAGGWTATGMYDRAVSLMGLPITLLGKLSDSVLFSGMSKMQSDEEALRRTVSQATQWLGMAVFPGAVWLWAMADEVTVLYLGPDFAAAAPIAAILFLGVPFRSLTKVGDAVVRAKDVLWAGLVWKVVFLGGVALAAWAGMRFGWGVRGVAWGVLAATAVQFVGVAGLVGRTCGMGWNWGRALVPGLVLAGAFAGAAWGADALFGEVGEWWGRALRLAVSAGGGVLVGGALLRWAPAVLAGAHPEAVAAVRKRLGWR